MKIRLVNPGLLLALLTGLLPTGRAAAQTFANLHNFTGGTNGANPMSGLIISSGVLYGTTTEMTAGSTNGGTVFKLNADGTGFTNLCEFTDLGPRAVYGFMPQAGLLLSGNTLYGSTSGDNGSGGSTLFAINTDGTDLKNLHGFSENGPDGDDPWGVLVLSGQTLYGTAVQGGVYENGTVFKINTGGTGYHTLLSFTNAASPYAGLVVAGNLLFGTTQGDGAAGNGTVFVVNTNGTGFTNLHSFTATLGTLATNGDGTVPNAGLLLSGGVLYGATAGGGLLGGGTLFALNVDGTGFTNLHLFYVLGGGGAVPNGLILAGGALYGTTATGGTNGTGTVFTLGTNGSGFKTLYEFSARSTSAPYTTNRDGATPMAGLLWSSNTLYGTTVGGGSLGDGTVFSLTLPDSTPRLNIVRSGPQIVLSWPTNAAGFTLRSTTNLAPPAVWSTVVPARVVVNGEYVVTNSISGPRRYYQLSQ